jgi:hypothetical protein
MAMNSDLQRRAFLAAGLGSFLAGCTGQAVEHRRAGIDWPELPTAAEPVAGVAKAPAKPAITPASAPPAPATPTPAPVGKLQIIPRDSWAGARPIAARLNPMNGVKRITVHHEGWTPVWFDDARSTAERLESIRRGHLDRLHAGDIGYHYIIDRLGRVWQGRSLQHQGAHVREQNENNLGVMVLGNFDAQQPTAAQDRALAALLQDCMRTHRVAVGRVYTHRELGKTTCPGMNLQSRMVALRKGALA